MVKNMVGALFKATLYPHFAVSTLSTKQFWLFFNNKLRSR